MYSREKRRKAVGLYIKYGKSAASVIRELGYPDRKTLPRWYKQHLEEQRPVAVRHYLEHGRNYSYTVRTLGYPSRTELANWLQELAPDRCRLPFRNGDSRDTGENRLRRPAIHLA